MVVSSTETCHSANLLQKSCLRMVSCWITIQLALGSRRNRFVESFRYSTPWTNQSCSSLNRSRKCIGVTRLGKLSSERIICTKLRSGSIENIGILYGSGAETWPPTNVGSIQLEDSFPFGYVPESALMILDDNKNQQKSKETQRPPMSSTSTKFVSKKLLFELVYGITAVGLLGLGYCRSIDALLAFGVVSYSWILAMVAKSTNTSGTIAHPNMPSLPPQGHVPALFDNPLGYKISHSILYNRWQKLGCVLELLIPSLLILYEAAISIQTSTSFITKTSSAAARPLFLICCQESLQSINKRILLPLPIQIMIPVMFNTLRVGYLWNWVLVVLGSVSSSSFATVFTLTLRGSATIGFIYSVLNLFAFLLPIAVVRYMRAHFFVLKLSKF